MAQTIPPLTENTQCCLDKELSIWLVNTSSEKIVMKAGELFGFNVGKFSEKSTGVSAVLISEQLF